MRKLRVLPGLLAMCLGAAAQAPTFEVASVKTATAPPRGPMICLIPCYPGERLSVEGHRVDIRNMSVANLIVAAHRIKSNQLSGPDWIWTQRFDILATIPDGARKDQVPEMLQALLVERFKLAIHRDTKEQPVMALVVGKNGSKLREAAADADVPVPAAPGDKPLYSGQGEGRMLENGDAVVTGGPLGPMRAHMGPGGIRVEFSKLTMAGLADLLTPHESHPVVDMTDLKGSYSFAWEDSGPAGGAPGGRKGGGPPDSGRSGGDDADAGPRRDPLGDALFAALEKAGLKLEARRAPVETIVVDHLEKVPTEN